MGMEYKKLVLRDVASLQTLLESNSGYSHRVSGRAPQSVDGHAILTVLPPGTNMVDKHAWGLWEDGKLVAFADVIRGYPSSNVAYIGLLMTAGGQSRRGLGRAMFGLVLGEINVWHGVSVVRLGIVEANAEVAAPFWQSLGFAPTGELKPHADGSVSSTVTLWEYSIPTPNAT